MSNILRSPCDEVVIKSGPCGKPCSKTIGRWILIATILGSSMAFIDGTAVNLALPALQSELNATVPQLQWVIEVYALLLGALILVGGSMGDHFGRKRIFGIGIALFGLASVWCGVARTVEELIIARGFQGVGAALLVPGSLAIISANFKDEERGRAIGTWSAFTAITMALGPVLGGWLVENVSWRGIFFINVPFAIVVLYILYTSVPESGSQSVKKLDFLGAALATIGLGALVYSLIESVNLGWGHPWVLYSLIGGTIALIAFFFFEAYSKSPMIPLSLFESKTFSGANLLTFFLYAALSIVLFFFPFNLIQIQGYTTTAAGAALLPLILIIFLLSRWAGGLIKRYGVQLPLIIGPIIAAIGYALFAVPEIGGSYWTTFFPAVALLGIGMAISITPLTTIVMSSATEHQTGIASGINNAVSRIAGLLAIAVLGIVMLATFNDHLDTRLVAIELPSEAYHSLDEQRIKLAAAEIPAGLSPEIHASLKQAIAESFVAGFRTISYTAVVLAVMSALTAWLMIKPRKCS